MVGARGVDAVLVRDHLWLFVDWNCQVSGSVGWVVYKRRRVSPLRLAPSPYDTHTCNPLPPRPAPPSRFHHQTHLPELGTDLVAALACGSRRACVCACVYPCGVRQPVVTKGPSLPSLTPQQPQPLALPTPTGGAPAATTITAPQLPARRPHARKGWSEGLDGLRWPPGRRVGMVGALGPTLPPFPSPPSLRDRQASGFVGHARATKREREAPTRITYQPGRGRFHAWFAAACCGGSVSVCERVGKRCERQARTKRRRRHKGRTTTGQAPTQNQRRPSPHQSWRFRNDHVSRWRGARNDRRVRLVCVYEDGEEACLSTKAWWPCLAFAPWMLGALVWAPLARPREPPAAAGPFLCRASAPRRRSFVARPVFRVISALTTREKSARGRGDARVNCARAFVSFGFVRAKRAVDR